MRTFVSFSFVGALALAVCSPARGETPLRLATFQVDATPPLGSPVAYAPVRAVLDPLSARGVVILSDKKAIVLCAVDWLGIGNAGHDAWCGALAQAAGTTPDRVTVHTLHQHDGARCDFSAEALLQEHGLGGKRYDAPFARGVIERAVAAVRAAIQKASPVSHLGVGAAKVEKVASNRRLLGPDGKVRIMRFSKSTNPTAQAAPEGVIDPYIRVLTFFDGDRPLAVLSYYATHPQSYYGQGDVTSEFVGLARAQREKALPGVPHIHFNGASGNVAAGKYNDGSKPRRKVLTLRMADGMRRAWEATIKTPIAAKDVQWRVAEVRLPVAKGLSEKTLQATLADADGDLTTRLGAARKLAWLRRNAAGRLITTSCLQLGDVYVLHTPGELFVEYQLAAQRMRPKDVVCMAAYGDYGPGYIGVEAAYSQGGYETSARASNVAPEVEDVLLRAIGKLLEIDPQAPAAGIRASDILTPPE